MTANRLLCEGGDKRTQSADIQRATERWLLEKLQDAEFAAQFLNAAGEDDDAKTYLTALRKVVDARGGIASVAERCDLSRETLYRTLSSSGNPTIKTLSAVLKATGLKFGVSAP